MFKILTFIACLSSFAVFAQNDFYYKNYDWKGTPEKIEVSAEDMEKSQVTLLEMKCVQFVFPENKNPVKYNLEHKIIQLNNDEAIERNNKYYVSNYGAVEVLRQKARVINPDGKIIELSAKDIQTSKDEKGNAEYQYFAFEGIEIGSIIEYFHVMTFPTSYTGDEVRVQSSSPKMNVTHEIICPSHLEFKIVSINKLPDFIKDTNELSVSRYVMQANHIEGISNESSSAYGANIGKYYFMLFKNLASGRSNFYNYQDVTKNIHGNMFAALNKKQAKVVKNILKESQVATITDLREKVRTLENYLKSTISVADIYMDGIADIEQMVKNKITNEDGMTKLMMNCLRELGIDFELVVTCDRTEKKFLSNFQGYNFLQEYLLYINELDEYYSANMFTRLGFPSTEFVYTEGLFIQEIKLNNLVSSIGKVKFIKGKDMDASVDNIITHATINEDKTTATVKIERKTTGYKSYYQSFMDVLDEEDKTEMKEEFLNYIDNDTKPEDVEFENESTKFYGDKPFIGRGTIKSPNFIEQAGNKMLFKIGMLIGPQAEMYNKEERKLPVETQHTRKYDRTITLEIPEGYEIKNLEDINISVEPDYNNKSMGFKSSYVIKGNQLIVTVQEWYADVVIPVEDYKIYETVMNAAADFNKIVLVLQTK
jgi:hypothetical protein